MTFKHFPVFPTLLAGLLAVGGLGAQDMAGTATAIPETVHRLSAPFAGARLRGLHQPGVGFGIWLSPNTTEPQLREALTAAPRGGG
jgi:hypothetical protein